MFDEDAPKRRSEPLAALAAEDLDKLSVAELEARTAALEAEIARVRGKLGAAKTLRAAAEGLFRS